MSSNLVNTSRSIVAAPFDSRESTSLPASPSEIIRPSSKIFLTGDAFIEQEQDSCLKIESIMLNTSETTLTSSEAEISNSSMLLPNESSPIVPSSQPSMTATSNIPTIFSLASLMRQTNHSNGNSSSERYQGETYLQKLLRSEINQMESPSNGPQSLKITLGTEESLNECCCDNIDVEGDTCSECGVSLVQSFSLPEMNSGKRNKQRALYPPTNKIHYNRATKDDEYLATVISNINYEIRKVQPIREIESPGKCLDEPTARDLLQHIPIPSAPKRMMPCLYFLFAYVKFPSRASISTLANVTGLKWGSVNQWFIDARSAAKTSGFRLHSTQLTICPLCNLDLVETNTDTQSHLFDRVHLEKKLSEYFVTEMTELETQQCKEPGSQFPANEGSNSDGKATFGLAAAAAAPVTAKDDRGSKMTTESICAEGGNGGDLPVVTSSNSVTNRVSRNVPDSDDARVDGLTATSILETSSNHIKTSCIKSECMDETEESSIEFVNVDETFDNIEKSPIKQVCKISIGDAVSIKKPRSEETKRMLPIDMKEIHTNSSVQSFEPPCKKLKLTLPNNIEVMKTSFDDVRERVIGFQCPHCLKIFSKEWMLLKHSLTHQSFQCYHCPEIFPNETVLKAHLLHHLFPSARNTNVLPKSSCPECNKPICCCIQYREVSTISPPNGRQGVLPNLIKNTSQLCSGSNEHLKITLKQFIDFKKSSTGGSKVVGKADDSSNSVKPIILPKIIARTVAERRKQLRMNLSQSNLPKINIMKGFRGKSIRTSLLPKILARTVAERRKQQGMKTSQSNLPKISIIKPPVSSTSLVENSTTKRTRNIHFDSAELKEHKFCRFCGEEFSSKTHLREHMFLHKLKSRSRRSINEELPGKEVEIKTQQDNEVENIPSSKEYKCSDCPEICASEDELEKHKVSQHHETKNIVEVPEQPKKILYQLRCFYCHKMFKREKDLRIHVKFRCKEAPQRSLRSILPANRTLIDIAREGLGKLYDWVNTDTNEIIPTIELEKESADSSMCSRPLGKMVSRCKYCGMEFDRVRLVRKHLQLTCHKISRDDQRKLRNGSTLEEIDAVELVNVGWKNKMFLQHSNDGAASPVTPQASDDVLNDDSNDYTTVPRPAEHICENCEGSFASKVVLDFHRVTCIPPTPLKQIDTSNIDSQQNRLNDPVARCVKRVVKIKPKGRKRRRNIKKVKAPQLTFGINEEVILESTKNADESIAAVLDCCSLNPNGGSQSPLSSQGISYERQDLESVEPQDIERVESQDVEIVEPQDVEIVEPQDVESVEPQDVESVEPQDVESVKPQDVESVKPQDVESVEPQDVEIVEQDSSEQSGNNAESEVEIVRNPTLPAATTKLIDMDKEERMSLNDSVESNHNEGSNGYQENTDDTFELINDLEELYGTTEADTQESSIENSSITEVEKNIGNAGLSEGLSNIESNLKCNEDKPNLGGVDAKRMLSDEWTSDSNSTAYAGNDSSINKTSESLCRMDESMDASSDLRLRLSSCEDDIDDNVRTSDNIDDNLRTGDNIEDNVRTMDCSENDEHSKKVDDVFEDDQQQTDIDTIDNSDSVSVVGLYVSEETVSASVPGDASSAVMLDNPHANNTDKVSKNDGAEEGEDMNEPQDDEGNDEDEDDEGELLLDVGEMNFDMFEIVAVTDKNLS